MYKIATGRTDVGRVRRNNEDSIYVCDGSIGILPNLYIVADGMGGHKAGEIASKNAISFFVQSVMNMQASKREISEIMRGAAKLANDMVFVMSTSEAGLSGMGTTFTAVCVAEDEAIFVHIGDSRVYHITRGEIKQATEDHSFVNEMVKSGEMTEEEARVSPKRNMLMRALGTETDSEIDVGQLPFTEGRLLLTSDGLTNMVSDEELFEIINGDGPDAEKADKLLILANNRGGTDNISFILI